MKKTHDYVHHYRGFWSDGGRCRIRIYREDGCAPLVICSKVPNNPGGSITNSAEVVAAGVIRANELPTPLVWIEHWCEEGTEGGEETFELVVFSSKNFLAFPLPRPRMPERTLTP